MKITKTQLRRIIKEEKANLVSEGKYDRRRKERDQMAAQMTFNQLRNDAYETASFIQNRLNTGLYEEEDIWGDYGEVNRLADTVDAAKIKAAEEGKTFDDVPDVRMANGGLLDLSYYSLGLPAGIKESKMKITKRQLRRIIRESILLEQSGGQVDEIITWAKTPGNRVDVDGKVAYAGIKPIMGIDITQDAADDYSKKGPAFENMIRSLPDGSKITLKQYGFKPSGGGSWKSHKTMYIGGTKPKAQPKLNTRRMYDILDITAGVQPDEIKSVNPYPGTDSPFPGQSWRVETNGGNVYLFPSGRNNRAEFAEKTDMHGRPSNVWQMTSINLR